MILHALVDLYDRLLKKGIISAPGWGTAKVSYALELSDGGQIAGLHSLKTEQPSGKKTKLLPQTVRVPTPEKRTVGIVSNFLCDNSGYILGVDNKGKPQRSRECFEDAKRVHKAVLDGVDTPAAKAIIAFFDNWSASSAHSNPILAKEWDELISGGNIALWYGKRPATDDEAICEAWQRYYAGRGEGDKMRCLVTGEESYIPKIHMSIKGVRNAQSSGASLVSFNAKAFESYEHIQNLNAPIGEYAAFAYVTALNYLLADRAHTQVIGDTTVVCWAKTAQTSYQDALMQGMMGVMGNLGDTLTQSSIRSVLSRLADGKPADWNDDKLFPDTRFYVLGLSPNSARLCVRFFFENEFGQFAKNVEKHYRDVEINGQKYYGRYDDPYPRTLLDETVNRNARTPAPVPQMSGSLMRSILTGTSYPRTLLNQVLIRIRAEQDERDDAGNIRHRAVSRGRAAIIKAFFLRANNTSIPKEVLSVGLNTDTNYLPYLLGRLFYTLESIQEAQSDGKILSTIRDRYYNAACTTPRNTFPALFRLEISHMKKLRRDKPGLAVNLDRQLSEIMGSIDSTTFPRLLSPEEQCAFHLGYYHQVQKRYDNKKEEK